MAEPLHLSMRWDPTLIVISYLVSVQACYTAIMILQMRFNRLLIALAAFSVSVSGIWAMHFLGMAAMTIDAAVTYNVGWTVASALFAYIPALLAFLLLDARLGKQPSTQDISLAVHIEVLKKAPHGTIAASAGMIALGVCTMHYTGMHAMDIPNVTKHYDVGVLVPSLFIAMFASVAALYFAFVLPITRRFTIPTALVAGVAVSGMHYVGMYAVDYHVKDEALPLAQPSSSITSIVLEIVFASSLISSSSLAFSSFLYRRKLREAADASQIFAEKMLRGEFDALQTLENNGNVIDDESELTEEEIREDPMMGAIKNSYKAMGSQLKQLRSFLPASLLAQFQAAQQQDDGEDSDDDEGTISIVYDANTGRSTGGGTRGKTSGVDGCTHKTSYSESSGTTTGSHLRQTRFSKELTNKTVAVLMLNLHGFQAKCREGPYGLADHYSQVTSIVVSVAKEYRGIVDSMHGDRFMLSFNASQNNAHYVNACLWSALALANRLESYCISVGVAVGPALVGNLGTSDMMRYTLIGSVVAQADELERICRKLHRTEGTHVLTANIPQEARFVAELRPLDIAMLKGHSKPVLLEEVLSLRSGESDEWMYELQNRQNGDMWYHLMTAYKGYATADTNNSEATGSLQEAKRMQEQAASATSSGGVSSGAPTGSSPITCKPHRSGSHRKHSSTVQRETDGNFVVCAENEPFPPERKFAVSCATLEYLLQYEPCAATYVEKDNMRSKVTPTLL